MGQKDSDRLAAQFTQTNPMQIHVITMSDRASKGEYEDKSGPAIRKALEAFFEDSGVSAQIHTSILPDSAPQLKAALRDARDSGTHAVFTTGGTGVGPRDITPDVVMRMADTTIPGIMEVIRVKYGMDNPRAALSRTVAAVMGKTIVYTIPGSPKGVTEYMEEILKTFDHLLCVLHGVDQHEN